MIQLSAHTPIYIGLDVIDFRCGIDKLAVISAKTSGLDPKSGAVFIFRNRSATSFKILVFDGTGYWLCQKRLSEGRLKYWPKTAREAELSAEAVLLILRGDDPRGSVGLAWKKVKTILDVAKTRTESFEGRDC